MALEKTEALVLRSIKFGETSRILTFLTREFGLVKAIAKGARAERPKFGAALDPFARSELVLYLKEGRDLQIVGQADLIEPFLALSNDVERYAFGSAAAEYLSQVAQVDGDTRALFEVGTVCLTLMAAAAPATLPYILRAFQLQVAALLGHGPEMAACVLCAGRRGEPVGLAPAAGGVVCAACSRETAGAAALSVGARAVLQAYLGNPLTMAARQRLEPGLRAEVGRATEAFLAAQLPGYRGLKSLRLATVVRS